MPRSWPLSVVNFSGRKFATRYGLVALDGDFWISGKLLYVKDGVVLPDDPPIMEISDPPADPNAALKAAINTLLADTTNNTLATKVKAVMTEWKKKL